MGPQPAPQVLEHLRKSVALTLYDCRWVPSSARFVVLGCYAKGTGALQVYELRGNEAHCAADAEKASPLKCGTFGASSLVERHLATGNFAGEVQIWDLERPQAALFRAQAHAGIINAIDGCGGQDAGHGPPEVVSGGRDGCVRVWDARQRDAPVAALEPDKSQKVPECWAVAFGNAHSDTERCVVAGYANGALRLWDLRTNGMRWEGTLPKGVCGLQFDRPDIPMNKFVAAGLEGELAAFDTRTLHPKQGFARASIKEAHGATVWGVRHLPQNRELCAVLAGDGSLAVYKYRYPDQRRRREGKHAAGVPGALERVLDHALSSQPCAGFDWSPDRLGLFCAVAFDQCIRVGFVTKLDLL